MYNSENINIDRLRNDLIDYFGSATMSFPIALMDLIDVEKASDDELIQMARRNGFDLENYVTDINRRTRWI